MSGMTVVTGDSCVGVTDVTVVTGDNGVTWPQWCDRVNSGGQW
jgi:DNA-binding cell septation regulator SpoVG